MLDEDEDEDEDEDDDDDDDEEEEEEDAETGAQIATINVLRRSIYTYTLCTYMQREIIY